MAALELHDGTTPADEVGAQSGLRARKKEDTRRTLVQTAYRLTIDRGFHHFTVGDLTRAAGVSRRTFSNYFASKAECVIAVHEEHASRIIAQLGAAGPDEPIDQTIRRLLRLVTQEFDEPEWADFAQLTNADPELRGEAALFDGSLASAVAGAIADHLAIPATDVVAQALGQFAMVSCRVVLDHWLAAGRPDGTAGLTALLERVFLLLDPTALAAVRHSSPHRSPKEI